MDVHAGAVLCELMRESEIAAVLYSPLTLLVRHSLFFGTSGPCRQFLKERNFFCLGPTSSDVPLESQKGIVWLYLCPSLFPKQHADFWREN